MIQTVEKRLKRKGTSYSQRHHSGHILTAALLGLRTAGQCPFHANSMALKVSCLFVWGRVSACSPAWPWVCILWPQPSKLGVTGAHHQILLKCLNNFSPDPLSHSLANSRETKEFESIKGGTVTSRCSVWLLVWKTGLDVPNSLVQSLLPRTVLTGVLYKAHV